MQIARCDASDASTCPVPLDDLRCLLELSPNTCVSGHYLVAHTGHRLLGVMPITFSHYPLISADVPVISKNACAEKVTRALLGALQHEVVRHGRLEAQVIHDITPTASQEIVACQLDALGFMEIGRSIYMSKVLDAGHATSDDARVRLVTAREYGMGRFVQAMAACAQPPMTDCRIQPRCQSLEGAALTIRDLARNSVGDVDPDQCNLVLNEDTIVAVTIVESGFVKWINVHPAARRTGIGRHVLLALERIWLEQGIRRAGLQVMSTNTAAAALYTSLGYASHGENSPRIWQWRIDR